MRRLERVFGNCQHVLARRCIHLQPQRAEEFRAGRRHIVRGVDGREARIGEIHPGLENIELLRLAGGVERLALLQMLRIHMLVRAGDFEERVVPENAEVGLRDLVEHREFLIGKIALCGDKVLTGLEFAGVDASPIADEDVQGDVRCSLPPLLSP